MANIKDNAWHHIGVTRKDNDFKLYVDGIAQEDLTDLGEIVEIEPDLFVLKRYIREAIEKQGGRNV